MSPIIDVLTMEGSQNTDAQLDIVGGYYKGSRVRRELLIGADEALFILESLLERFFTGGDFDLLHSQVSNGLHFDPEALS